MTDVDGDGDIEANIVVEVLTKVNDYMKKARIGQTTLLRIFDKNADNKITQKELVRGFKKSIKMELNDEEAATLMAEFDKDGSGEIDLREMLDYFKHFDPTKAARDAANAEKHKYTTAACEETREGNGRGVLANLKKAQAARLLPNEYVFLVWKNAGQLVDGRHTAEKAAAPPLPSSSSTPPPLVIWKCAKLT